MEHYALGGMGSLTKITNSTGGSNNPLPQGCSEHGGKLQVKNGALKDNEWGEPSASYR